MAAATVNGMIPTNWSAKDRSNFNQVMGLAQVITKCLKHGHDPQVVSVIVAAGLTLDPSFKKLSHEMQSSVFETAYKIAENLLDASKFHKAGKVLFFAGQILIGYDATMNAIPAFRCPIPQELRPLPRAGKNLIEIAQVMQVCSVGYLARALEIAKAFVIAHR